MSEEAKPFSGSMTTWSLVGLLSGLALGVIGYQSGSAWIAGLSQLMEPIGSLWLNALQMVVLPLIVTQMLTAVVGTGGARAIGSTGVRALGLFAVLLFGVGIATLFLMPPVLSFFPIDSEVVASLQESVLVPPMARDVAAAGSSGAGDWITGLVPTNIFEAATSNQVLPLMIFAVLFGLAVNRLPTEQREPLAKLFRSVADATLVLIRWILVGTPVGVFALILGMTLSTGSAAVGIISAYVVCYTVVLLTLVVPLYPLAAFFGATSLLEFARFLVPAQLIGLSTRSSLAALPAHVENGRRRLRFGDATAGFTVPLSVTTLKLSTAASGAKALFLAHMFGIELGPERLAIFLVTVILMSFTTLGVPRGGGSFRTLPVYVALGVPVEGYIILEGARDLVDFSQTLINVTGHGAASTILSRGDRARRGS